jgi:ubiquinone/menaquinone biosynthesis C-methylase UbiE
MPTGSPATTAQIDADAKLAMVRDRWNEFAPLFTETANKRVTIQCAKALHHQMNLEDAQSVLEVAAGAALGSLDVLNYLKKGKYIITDLAPKMIEMAKETLAQVRINSDIQIQIQEANGQDLKDIPTHSIDRYISNMCLQLTPDPDAMLREAVRVLKSSQGIAGFTIWGKPEHSGQFTIPTRVMHELGKGDGVDNPNFALGKDLGALKKRFEAAGFKKIVMWPFLCVTEKWSGQAYSDFYDIMNHPPTNEDEHKIQSELMTRRCEEWLATGVPIGLEAIIILAHV